MLVIDPRSPTPPFEQLRAQVIEAVRAGEMRAGDKLPTVRKLAADLGLAANTVARAYRELEHDHFIETRGRNGSFISATGDATERQLQVAARTFADRAAELGVTPEEARQVVNAALGLR
jgi:DNA-binding transcriptional regulator YhcF (GntR family)